MIRNNYKPRILSPLLKVIPGTARATPGHGRPTRGTILFPTDYSEPSRQAFELACRIARERGSRLIVLHVAEPMGNSSPGLASVVPLPRGYRGGLEARLHLVQPQDPDVRAEHRLEVGDAATEILRVADETASDLIVMGTRFRAGLLGRLRSGVTGKVRRAASCPVLVLTAPPRGSSLLSGSQGEEADKASPPASNAPREEDMFKLKAIVHPTDFSRPAEKAFEFARTLARGSDSELIVVHVAPVPSLLERKGYREKVETALRRMTESDPTVRMRWVLLAGDPVPEILWMAREGLCDLIVMGTRGLTGLRRLLTPSVTAKIRRESPCPVVTVTVPAAYATANQEHSLLAGTTTVSPAGSKWSPGATNGARRSGRAGKRASFIPTLSSLSSRLPW